MKCVPPAVTCSLLALSVFTPSVAQRPPRSVLVSIQDPITIVAGQPTPVEANRRQFLALPPDGQLLLAAAGPQRIEFSSLINPTTGRSAAVAGTWTWRHWSPSSQGPRSISVIPVGAQGFAVAAVGTSGFRSTVVTAHLEVSAAGTLSQVSGGLVTSVVWEGASGGDESAIEVGSIELLRMDSAANVLTCAFAVNGRPSEIVVGDVQLSEDPARMLFRPDGTLQRGRAVKGVWLGEGRDPCGVVTATRTLIFARTAPSHSLGANRQYVGPEYCLPAALVMFELEIDGTWSRVVIDGEVAERGFTIWQDSGGWIRLATPQTLHDGTREGRRRVAVYRLAESPRGSRWEAAPVAVSAHEVQDLGCKLFVTPETNGLQRILWRSGDGEIRAH